MKFWKRLNNRGRILVLLLASLVLLNSIVLVTTYNLKSFSGSFASMLNDRLVPSTDIALIQEYCYKNRLFLEDLIFRKNLENQSAKIALNNKLLDDTFEKYQCTYFTKEETEHAAHFRKALQEHRKYEQEILVLLAKERQEEAEQLFIGESNQAFQAMINELHLLSGIQLTVGRLLYEHADENIQSIKLVAYISLFVSLIVASQLLKVLGIKPL